MHAMRAALERRLSLLVSDRSREIYAFLLGEDDAGERIEHRAIRPGVEMRRSLTTGRRLPRTSLKGG
jgi:hypothetical protein